ncbi:MAG: hypothetical protein IJY26_00265 [Clostridia bacterium]|nr:hypothetical protein [Clostridia bacterium]
MENKKSNSETLSEIYRNTQLAIQSISDILPEIEDENIKEEILREHEEYEQICAAATLIAKKNGQELKDPNPLKKAMMWSSIKMNTMTDKSTQHIADMMIQGTVMGITSLKKTQTDSRGLLDSEVDSLLKELISLEEGFERKLKAFL